MIGVHDSEQLVREVLAAGAHGFILKSDAGHALVAALDALSEHKPFFTPRVSALVLEGYLNPQQWQAETGVDYSPAQVGNPRYSPILRPTLATSWA